MARRTPAEPETVAQVQGGCQPGEDFHSPGYFFEKKRAANGITSLPTLSHVLPLGAVVDRPPLTRHELMRFRVSDSYARAWEDR